MNPEELLQNKLIRRLGEQEMQILQMQTIIDTLRDENARSKPKDPEGPLQERTKPMVDSEFVLGEGAVHSE